MIEDLKRIMNDEARPAAEREAAAKHILRLQAEEQDGFTRLKKAVDDLLNETHYEPAKSSVVSAKESSLEVEPTDGAQPATKQPAITSKQVAAALRWCDLELERLSQSGK